MGAGASIASEASDVTILTGDPGRVLEALALSSRAVRAMRQNLVFAFVYNALGIPLAVAGLVNPLVAVFAMFASSLTVIGNTLRLFRRSTKTSSRHSGTPGSSVSIRSNLQEQLENGYRQNHH
jgi:Cu+-exporting ATPase